MKKQLLSLIILCGILTGLVFLSGCTSKESQSNTSKNANDIWDYSSGIKPYLPTWNEGVLILSNGFYFVNSLDMLYFYDYKVKKSVPVCNKPDCEHRSSSNEDGSFLEIIGDPAAQAEWGTKRTDCNAYMCGHGNLTIYKERLYFSAVSNNDFMSMNRSLYSMKMDGTDRRVEIEDYFITTTENSGGMFFFSGDKFFFTNMKNENQETMQMIDLGTKKYTTLFTCNISKKYSDFPTLYQNSIYYILWNAYNPDNPQYTGTLYKYSLKTKKTTAIYTGDIAGYTFVKNQIYFSNGKTICKMSLDGKDCTPVFDAHGNLDVCFDGKYLYLDQDEFSVTNEQPESHPILVTKLDGTKVDSMDPISGNPIYGDQKIFLYNYAHSEKDFNIHHRIVMFNKDDLGKTHHYYDVMTGEEMSIEELTTKIKILLPQDRHN